MRRSALFVFFIPLSIVVYAQGIPPVNEWKELRIDGDVRFSFPVDHQLVDSGHTRFYVAGDSSEIYQLAYSLDGDPGYINSAERLDHQYGEWIKGVLNALPSGKLLSRQPRTIGEARAVQLSASFDMYGEEWLYENLYLNIKRKGYHFIVMHPSGSRPDVEGYFGAVKVDPRIDLDAQMTTDILSLASPEKWGYLIGKLGMALLTIFVIIFLVRRYAR